MASRRVSHSDIWFHLPRVRSTKFQFEPLTVFRPDKRRGYDDSMSAIAAATAPALISGLVPMIHVTDVERSAEFYRLLGFEIGNYVPREGPMHWAWLHTPKAADWKRGPNLMLTRGECPIDASVQEVLFYLYAADLELQNAARKRGASERDCVPRILAEG